MLQETIKAKIQEETRLINELKYKQLPWCETSREADYINAKIQEAHKRLRSLQRQVVNKHGFKRGF